MGMERENKREIDRKRRKKGVESETGRSTERKG
jgi:hypothetical protein